MVDEPINEYRQRLDTWQQLSLFDVPLPQRRSKEQKVLGTANELNRMINALHTAGEPLLRVLAVLDGDR